MSNIFAVLANEDGDAPAAGKGAAKAKKAGGSSGAAAAGKKPLPVHSFPGEQPAGANKHSARVPDRQKDNHRGGASARGGRGGARSGDDPTVRQFDRHGAPTRYAPGRAKRDGAALGPEGGVSVQEGESAADVVAAVEATGEAAASAAPAAGGIEEVDPEDDGTQTYEQFLAAQAARRVEEDLQRQIRQVEINESDFKKVKPLVREGEEEKAKADAEEEERVARRKEKKEKKVISLDEFRGGREGDAKYRAPREFDNGGRGGRGGFEGRGGRGGRGGFEGRGGGRGGFSARGPAPAAAAADGSAPAAPAAGDAPARGGFQPRGRGGRGGFEGRGGRGGRGGFEGRGGRGGYVPRGRGGFHQAPVSISDERAFPALA